MSHLLDHAWAEVVGVVESVTNEWVVMRASTIFRIPTVKVAGARFLHAGIEGAVVGIILLPDGSMRLRKVRREGAGFDK